VAARPPLRYRPLWLAVGWAGVVLVIYLSLTSSPLPSGEMLGFDFAHGAAYASLMFWFAQLYVGRGGRATSAVALVAMGVALEIAQGWTGYRGFSYADMRDDAIGVALGWWLATTPLSRMLPFVDSRLARAGGGG
jgi:VanZ family protein